METSCLSMVIGRHGGPEVFRAETAPLAPLAAGGIRIRVAAAGVNFADVFARMGLYDAAPPPPFVPGFEAAGVVTSVGASVTGFRPGDRVVGIRRFGAYATIVDCAAHLAIRIPDGVTDEEAAGFPCVFATAYHALFRLGHLEEGQSVLIHAAAGGVGMAAIQLARSRGARILATCGGDRKVDLVRSWGVEEVLDYTRHDFEPWVRDRTEGRGVDLILDSVGGTSFRRGYRLLAPMGHLVMFGMAGFCPTGPTPSWLALGLEYLRQPTFSPMRMIPDNRTVSGFNLVYLFGEKDLISTTVSALASLWRTARLRVHVGRTFPLESAGEAQEYLRSRQSVGKVVLVPAHGHVPSTATAARSGRSRSSADSRTRT
jgi:NADPH:quinone reductase-like Zn-dependent oxidoreductase